MEWQRSYIERGLGLAATSGTRTIDLPKSALLSDLMLRFWARNGDNPNVNNPLYDKITKVEVIVNGSEVVKSLNAKEIQALAFYDTGKKPHRELNDWAGAEQWEHIPIHFGRFPGDLEYGLDCKKVTNPQLKITWDTTGAGSISTALFSITDYPVIDLLATQLLEGPATFPKGYIKSHEITTWDPTANSETKRVELPVGNLFRRIVVRCYAPTWWPRQGLAYTYLDLNVGVRQPFKMETEDWVQLMRQWYGKVTQSGRIALTNVFTNMKFGMGILAGVAGVCRTDNIVVCSNGGSGGTLSMCARDITAADGTGEGIVTQIIAHGDLYHSCFCLPFDKPTDDFMLDSSKWTDVDLVLEAAASGISSVLPNLAVVLEEVIKK